MRLTLNKIKLYSIFTYFVINVSFITLAIADDDPVLSLADNLFNNNDYFNSATEYKRFIFFNSDSSKLSYAYCKLGICFSYLNNDNESFSNLDLSLKYANNDSIKNIVRLLKSILYLKAGNYDLAQLELLKISIYETNTEIKSYAQFFLCVCFIHLYEWKKAQQIIEEYNIESVLLPSQKHSVDSLIILGIDYKEKSVKTASFLSTIIPGLGQIYAGNIKQGINAFCINTLESYYIINWVTNKRYFDAFLLFYGGFLKYYKGNLYYTKRLIEDKNNDYKSMLSKKIINIMFENNSKFIFSYPTK